MAAINSSNHIVAVTFLVESGFNTQTEMLVVWPLNGWFGGTANQLPGQPTPTQSLS